MDNDFDENKIEKDIQTFSIFTIYDTDFNDTTSIVNSLDKVLCQYKDYNRMEFFIDPFFQELTKYYINSYNFLNTNQYEEIIKYCKDQLKIEKYENNYCSQKLYEYYKIIEENRDVDDKTFSLIVNTYTFFADFGNMEEYILKRLLEETNTISRCTYINFFKKLANNLYNTELKKYNKKGQVVFGSVNDKNYDQNNLGLYVHCDEKIIMSIDSLKQEKMITNLQTLFHEINHAKQYNDEEYYNYDKNEMRKEIILKYLLEKEYEKNYWSFKHEYDADYKARLDTINFIRKYTTLEIEFPKMEYNQNNLRIINGELIHIDQLFDNIIKTNIGLFRKSYYYFNLEYDENGNRYLISKFILEKSLTNDEYLIKYYNELIYKHCYSYKEILVNIKDLVCLIESDKEHADEYKNVLYDLINEKFMIQSVNNIKNIKYKSKKLVKKIFSIK